MSGRSGRLCPAPPSDPRRRPPIASATTGGCRPTALSNARSLGSGQTARGLGDLCLLQWISAEPTPPWSTPLPAGRRWPARARRAPASNPTPNLACPIRPGTAPRPLLGLWPPATRRRGPGLAWLGHEARGYPFGTFCVLLAWWSYERWWRTRVDRWLTVMVISQLLAVYFSMYAAMLLPLYVLRACLRGWRAAVKTGACAAVIGMWRWASSS